MANTININISKVDLGLNNVDNTSDLNKPISTATQNYVDTAVSSATTPDATTLVKGKVRLAGDLAGTANSPTVPGLAERETIYSAQSANLNFRFNKKTLHATSGTGLSYNPLTGNIGVYVESTMYINVTSVMIHNDSVAPTFTSEFTKSADSLPYITGQDNYIYATLVNLDPIRIIYTIKRGGTNIYGTFLTTDLKGANNGLAELDGSGKVPSSQLPSYVEYVAPEMFGAIGDGTTDDTTAFQNAINSGKPVVLGKATYYISAPLNVTNNRTIVGYGYESKIKTTTNMSCILIQGSNNYISGVSFLGSGKGVVGKEEQIGINIFGNVGLTDNFNKNVIDNCFFTDMSGSGFYGKQVVGTYHEGNTVSNCVAFNCTQGFYLDLRFEYTNVNSCKASNCNIGGRIRGGNNNFSNCNFSDNLYNIYLESGSNDGHGSFVGGQLNHAEVNNILSNGIALGYTFNGTQIYAGGTGDAGNITLAGDNLISFVGCMISVEYFDFGTSVNTKLVGNSFDTTPIYQNYVAANVWFGNNVYKTTRPTEDPVNKIIANATTDTDKFLVSDSDVIKYRTGAELLSDINGASKDLTLDRKTASYTLVANDNNKLIEMNVGSANNVTIDSGVFTAGNQILVSQYGAGQTTIKAGAGVTLRSSGGKLKTSAQYSLVTIIAISSTEFYVAGDLTA